jgi:RNA polymerase sigma factor (sigma-70 family)
MQKQDQNGPVSGVQDDLTLRFRGPLMVYFLKRVNHYADAEDLTQEAFARLAAHPDRTDGKALSSYIFTIAANLLRDRARMRIARRQDSQDPIDSPQPPPGLVEDIHPERVLLGKEALKDVVAALEELGAQTRDIFIMSRLERVPQREIAALYGVSVSAIEKHMIRATAFIGARLKR